MASARFFAPAKLFARSKPESMLRRRISMSLWFSAVAPSPEAREGLVAVNGPDPLGLGQAPGRAGEKQGYHMQGVRR
jgi:hypothetical protein